MKHAYKCDDIFCSNKVWIAVMNNFTSLFLDYFKVNASTDAANVDADTENQTGATFSSCITLFPEKPYQSLSLKFPTGTFDNDPKERSFKSQWC